MTCMSFCSCIAYAYCPRWAGYTYPLTQILDFRVAETKVLKAWLDIFLLARLDLDFFDRHLFPGQFLLHAVDLGWQQHEQGMAVRIETCGTAHTMDIRVGILRAVKLEDPVHSREVETTRGNVRRDQSGVLGRSKFAKDLDTLCLFLFAVEMEDGQTGLEFTEAFVDETGLFAARDKNDGLILQMGAEERVEDVEFVVQFTDDVMLRELLWCGVLGLFVDGDVFGVLQRETRQALDGASLGRRKEEGLSLWG